MLTRRSLIAAGASFPFAKSWAAAAARPAPNTPAWPAVRAWNQLRVDVHGRLQPVIMPDLKAPSVRSQLGNPFFIREQAGLTQSSGWIDAWRSMPSAFVVRPRDAADVAAAVRFAALHQVRLVVKGGGHSYFGGSCAPNSLLVWTRDLNTITVHDAFVPAGSTVPPVPAVSLGAGCIWLDAYKAVTGGAGRYVQGGGCTTVGVAGLIQGGGFGSFSKRYGLAAASLLEAELVTADGQVRVVNADQDPDLLWALKGGGGGTFGIVTRLTLRTHALPTWFGLVRWQVRAKSDEDFRSLLNAFVDHYTERLFDQHWGEQVRIRPGNVLQIFMTMQGLDGAEARDRWRAFEAFVAERHDRYEIEKPLALDLIPPTRMWDGEWLRDNIDGLVTFDPRANTPGGNWWWAGNAEEAGTFWHGYQSMWLPAALLATRRRSSLADSLFSASRHWSVSLHFNKGLAGAPAEALTAARAAAINPQVAHAFALAIVADDGPTAFTGLSTDNRTKARVSARAIQRAADALRTVAPGAGSYISESDYSLGNWQAACWGENYERLLRVKQRVDPHGLFTVHHGVGSAT